MTYARARASATEGTLAVDNRTTTMLKRLPPLKEARVACFVCGSPWKRCVFFICQLLIVLGKMKLNIGGKPQISRPSYVVGNNQ